MSCSLGTQSSTTPSKSPAASSCSGRDVPELLEGLVVQPQAAVGAEHRHGVGELVERRLLHLDQGVVLGLQLQLVGDVGEQQQQAAHRVRLAHDPQGAAVGQAPHVVGRGGRAARSGRARRPSTWRSRRSPAGGGAGAGGRAPRRGWAARPARPAPGPTARRRRCCGRSAAWPGRRSPPRRRCGSGSRRAPRRCASGLLAQLLQLGDVVGPDADAAALQRLGGDRGRRGGGRRR